MQTFTPLIVEYIKGTKYCQLVSSLHFTSSSITRVIVVEKGFLTDFASVPRILRSFIDNDDPSIRKISVVHDYGYSTWSNYYKLTRKTWDQLLLEGLLQNKVSPFKAYSAYYAVRWFGKRYYKATRPNIATQSRHHSTRNIKSNS